ncbi:hypothetical protein GCM10010289_53240 [Streptomyces violascens]|uniref:Uncharacterized protein n=1 Tax=Streptomyces violascens TaxID=67381 RepID=A0ABQ3QNW3_9ACTN|nr:hypothetical protein GCM10010289_53240 [Streptomyces violascens]GHI38968.1 hypothetical protein Sviol_33760 [Streptomyces violascens]
MRGAGAPRTVRAGPWAGRRTGLQRPTHVRDVRVRFAYEVKGLPIAGTVTAVGGLTLRVAAQERAPSGVTPKGPAESVGLAYAADLTW